MMKLAKFVKVGELVRPVTNMRDEGFQICHPVFSQSMKELPQVPSPDRHSYDSFEFPDQTVMLVLGTLYAAPSAVRRGTYDYKFAVACEKGLGWIWVYSDEPFEVINL